MSSEQQTNFVAARKVLQQQLKGGANAEELGADLFAASDLLRDNLNLLRALTDPGRDREARQKLARTVFAGHVDKDAVSVIEESAGEHWHKPDDLASELGTLGLAAYVEAASQTIGVQKLCQQLVDVMGLVSRNRDLRVDLSDLGPGTPEQRADLACKIFKSHLAPETAALVKRAVATTHYGELIQKLRNYAEVAAELDDKKLIVATSATPLSEKQEARLTYLASKKWDTPVLMTWDVDQDLVGGFRLDMGERAVDTSVRADLHQARLALTS